jgi:hypothetical protein
MSSSFQNNLLGAGKNWLINKGSNLIFGTPNEGNANRQSTGGMQRFLTEINSDNGFYRGVFFEVYIHGLRDIQSEYSTNLLCHRASLPGFRLETKNNIIYSLPYETPVGVEFDPAWFTFYIDNNFIVNNAIWQSTFNSTDATIGRINPTSWSPKYRDPANLLNIEIVAFSPDFQQTSSNPTSASNSNQNNVQYNGESKTWDGLPILARYVLNNCFFKTVQQTPVAWDAHNDISTLTIEVSYEWYDAYYPNTGARLASNDIKTAPAPLNFDTIITKYPALGIAYDAAKKTILQNPAIMNNPLLNQGSQFLP